MAEMDSVKINGHIFALAGLSTYDGSVHLHIRAFNYTLYDIQNAIEEGNDPIVIYDGGDEQKPLYVFDGFSHLTKISADYNYKFTPSISETAITVVMSKPQVTMDDITDIQLALAELAEMIGGDENG